MNTKELRQALRSGTRHQQAAAAIELGRRADKASAAELKRLMDASDDLVAVSSMFGCWLLKHRRVSIARAVKALASDHEETVQLAVQALCEMGEQVVPQLSRLLEAGSPQALQILRILGDIGGRKGFEVVEKTTHSPTPHLAAAAREVLADWG